MTDFIEKCEKINYFMPMLRFLFNAIFFIELVGLSLKTCVFEILIIQRICNDLCRILKQFNHSFSFDLCEKTTFALRHVQFTSVKPQSDKFCSIPSQTTSTSTTFSALSVCFGLVFFSVRKIQLIPGLESVHLILIGKYVIFQAYLFFCFFLLFQEELLSMKTNFNRSTKKKRRLRLKEAVVLPPSRFL
jgi:hypothetical protein